MPKVNTPTDTIRLALEAVSDLREARTRDSALRQAVSDTKSLQSQRFAATYADLLADPAYAAAVRFFLYELYADRDFAERDTQFSRIAGTLQKVFPAAVVSTACALADLHALTEQLDQSVAMARLKPASGRRADGSVASTYLHAFRTVGQEVQRRHQLEAVLKIGNDLARLTRTPGLRTLLRLMRQPAQAAGLAALQQFLESGFDTFATLTKQPGGAQAFLDTIATRESAWMDTLFHTPWQEASQALQTALDRH